MVTDAPSTTIHSLLVRGEAATARLAAVLADVAKPGDIIALWGELGAGKTVFARAFINELTGHAEEVPSPTFTLVQLYDGADTTIYHFDMYRLDKPDDALELGVEDAFADGISLIEWPGNLGPWLPRKRLDVSLKNTAAEHDRIVEILANSTSWNERLAALPAWDTIEGITTDS